MATCHTCGETITFRYMNGRPTPIHRNGYCAGGSKSTSSKGNKKDNNEPVWQCNCFLTNCRHCGKSVFFIRHNGGSVWIDPPLGPPWNQHPCMKKNATKGTIERVETIFGDYIRKKGKFPENAKVGTVQAARFDHYHKKTELVMDIGNKYPRKLTVAHNAKYLVGKMCILDEDDQGIRDMALPEYRYAVLANDFDKTVKSRHYR